jgi:trehalose 6-phosphate phosphatase
MGPIYVFSPAMTPNPSPLPHPRAGSLPGRNANEKLPEPGEIPWALFLDVDGTLVEIAADPDAVHVDGRLITLLTALQNKLNGAVALVSGRTIATLDHLFSPLLLPAAGNHGLERRASGGEISRPPANVEMLAIRDAFADFAAENPGTILEDKTLSMAIHFRNRPELEKAATDLAENLVAGSKENLFLQRGKKLVEIRPGQGDKGTAIADFLAEAPFSGRLPVFIGDDVTDEKGFELINRHGGHSIRVGNDVTTAALYHVADVTGVIRWLEDMVGA